MPINQHTILLKDALQNTGFVRRGSAFFRVWGDGVLQTLKFERSSIYSVHDLHVGVASMYGKLDPCYFTSRFCLTRESIATFVGLRNADGYLSPHCFNETDDGQFIFEGFPISIDPTHWINDTAKYFFTPEQQIQILKEKVLPWLNDITSQSSAAKALYKLFPFPHDSLRFYAHLAAGELTQAEETMTAVLTQHANAYASWEKTFSKEKFAEMMARAEEGDAPLKELLRMVQEKDEQAISNHLMENYKTNCEAAKFCMK